MTLITSVFGSDNSCQYEKVDKEIVQAYMMGSWTGSDHKCREDFKNFQHITLNENIDITDGEEQALEESSFQRIINSSTYKIISSKDLDYGEREIKVKIKSGPVNSTVTLKYQKYRHKNNCGTLMSISTKPHLLDRCL